MKVNGVVGFGHCGWIRILSSPSPVNGQDSLSKNLRVIMLPRVSSLKNNKILFTVLKINK
jgi:hypothetical protein